MDKRSQFGHIVKIVLGITLMCSMSVSFVDESIAQAKRFTSPPASREYWNVFCNKKGRNVVLGIHRPNVQHHHMAGPFNNEPEARNWVNRNCSSWQCDWNGRCIQPSGNRPCPPGTYRDSGVFGQGSGNCVPIRR